MKKKLCLLLAAAMLLGMTACGGSSESTTAAPETTAQEETTAAETTEAETTAEETTEAETDAITVTDMSGDEVTIEGEVNTIVNLWPAGTSSFFAMGAGDLIVGVGNNSAGAMNGWTTFFYPGAKEITCLSGTSPTIEEIINLNPDLVIIHPTTAADGFAGQIREAGIPAININFTDYETMVQAYTILAEILGGEYAEKLNTWCSAIEEKIATVSALTESIPEEERPIVYYVAGQQEDLLTTMAANSIMQSWTEAAGGRYATALIDFNGESAKGTNITAEEVFALNPDVVIIGGTFQHSLIEQIQTTDGWKDLNAVVNDRVYNNPYGCFNWDRFGLESLLQIDYAFMCIQPELAEENGINRDSMVQEVIDFYAYYNGTTLTEEQAGNMLDGLLPDGTVEQQ